MNIEEFFKSYQHTIAAFGVLGTFLAVVVALFSAVIALRASRTRVSASASINRIHHGSMHGKERPRYLVASIRNLGTMPVHIPMGFFDWKLPLQRGMYEVLPMDYSAADEWVPQKRYPVEIKARGSETFFLSPIAMFHDYVQSDLIGSSAWRRFRSRFLYAFVFTDEGKTFRVKFDSSLRKELARLLDQNKRAVSPR
jgi:hypothetical protein